MPLAVCDRGVAAGCASAVSVVGVAVEAKDLAHVDGDAGPVPGGCMLVCLRVPEAEEEGGLEEGDSVGGVVVHGLFFISVFCIRVWVTEEYPCA